MIQKESTENFVFLGFSIVSMCSFWGMDSGNWVGTGCTILKPFLLSAPMVKGYSSSVDPVVYSNSSVAAVPICFTPLPTIISSFSAKTPHPCMYIFVVAEEQMNGVPPLNFEVSRLGTLDFSLFLL